MRDRPLLFWPYVFRSMHHARAHCSVWLWVDACNGPGRGCQSCTQFMCILGSLLSKLQTCRVPRWFRPSTIQCKYARHWSSHAPMAPAQVLAHPCACRSPLASRYGCRGWCMSGKLCQGFGKQARGSQNAKGFPTPLLEISVVALSQFQSRCAVRPHSACLRPRTSSWWRPPWYDTHSQFDNNHLWRCP